jgi:hypothetical protein
MSHPVVESYRKDAIDICELRRAGLLDGGRHRITGGLRFPKLRTLTIDPTAIEIVFHHGQEQSFKISWSKCFEASERPWIVCNHCGQRYARLFRGFAGYACRQCLQVWYACQCKSTRNRQRARLVQLCLRIDDRPSHYNEHARVTLPPRPPGIHRARYFRLYGRAADLQARLSVTSKTLCCGLITTAARGFQR